MGKNPDALFALKEEIARKLCEIEDICKGFGLKQISLFTCVARDPLNDNMIVVVSNESGDGLEKAFKVALETDEKVPAGL